jgi:hypothetical protein
MVRRAYAVRFWASVGAPDEIMPLENLSAYNNQSNPKGFTQYISTLQGYFEKIKKGDLVIIPPSAYSSNAVLVEMVDDALSEPKYVSIPRYSPFHIPARRFRVVASVRKKDLPDDILDIISKPSALVLAPASSRPKLYSRAYNSWVFQGGYTTKLHIASSIYSSSDDINILAFVNFVATNTKLLTIQGQDDTVGIRDAAFYDLGEFAPVLRSNVNSPGFLSLASPYITPLVLSVMLALAVEAGPEAAEMARSGMVTVGNSSAPSNDPCTAAVHESVVTQLRLYFDKWPEACEIAKKAAKDTGLRSDSQVRK